MVGQTHNHKRATVLFLCRCSTGRRGLNDRVHLEQDEVFNSSPVLPILALPVLAGGILALPVLAGGHGG